MHDWIALDGVKSNTIPGLTVMEYTLPLLPRRQREETVLPGRLTAIQQRAWQQDPADMTIMLAITGGSMQDIMTLWHGTVLPWLYRAARLETDSLPGLVYRGAVTSAEVAETTSAWIRAKVIYRCNPPCLLRYRSGQSGWWPEDDTPIPQQLTADTATVSGSYTAPGWLTLPQAVGGLEAAEVYLAISGTWTSLQLGSAFALEWAAQTPETLYIDAENGQVWRLDTGASGTEINMMGVTTGALPQLMPGDTALRVGGTGINITVRMLVVERG